MRGKFIELTPKTMQLSLFLSDSIKLLAKRYIYVKSLYYFFRQIETFTLISFSNRLIFHEKNVNFSKLDFSPVKSEKRIFFFCVQILSSNLISREFWALGPNFLFSKILFFASVDRVVSNLYQGEEHVWVGFWCGQRQGETGKRCW